MRSFPGRGDFLFYFYDSCLEKLDARVYLVWFDGDEGFLGLTDFLGWGSLPIVETHDLSG